MPKAKILLVEDEGLIALDIRSSLENYNYEVCSVAINGKDAIAKAKEHRPDLVLMDIKLEGDMDGIVAAREIGDTLNIPIVYLTAHSDEQMLQRAKLTRPFAYLLKPFDERELYISVEIALSRRSVAPLIEVCGSDIYYACRHALETGALLQGNVEASNLKLTLLPGNEDISSMGDSSADILDVILAVWLQQADTHASTITLSADDILRSRQLRLQKSGSGKRGGYKHSWKQKVANELQLMSRVLLCLEEQEALLLEINSTPENYTWNLRPGYILAQQMFNPNRQNALLSHRTLTYDPYRQKWEKRMSRYLSWQWAQMEPRFNDPYSVGDLLTSIGFQVDQRNPLRTKERFENALNTLQQDMVIESWNYPEEDLEMMGVKGWVMYWLQWQVQILPPLQVRERYYNLVPYHASLPASASHPSFSFIRHIRESFGITQAQAAQQIGITQARLSQIENGGRVSQKLSVQLKNWLNQII